MVGVSECLFSATKGERKIREIRDFVNVNGYEEEMEGRKGREQFLHRNLGGGERTKSCSTYLMG